MSFPSYPVYKYSGVEWLGDVPAQWAIKAFRRVIQKSLSNGIFKKKEDFGRGVLLINVFDVYRHDFKVDYLSLDRVDCNAAELVSYAVDAGDLFFVRSSLKYEGISVVAVADTCLEAVVYECHLIRARPNSASLDGRYGSYLFNSNIYRAIMISKAKLTTMTTIDQEAISSTLIPVPRLFEQTQIARFLDHETARIDALIEEQQRLIELLKEKRQALISHAVTKGLDPTVPMKDSGVEWLGEVPAHWVVAAVKRYCDVRDGTHSTPEYVDRSDYSFPLVTSKDISSEGISLVEASHISAYDHHEISRRSGVARGDILMPMIGTIGGAVVVDIDEQFSIKNIALFKKGNFSSSWLAYLLDSDVSRIQFELNKSGGVQGFVSLGTLRNLIFPTPCLEEQENIIRFIDQKMIAFDQLIAEAYKSVGLMLERRSALISAAVTGKIDVRSWQPPRSAPSSELVQEAV